MADKYNRAHRLRDHASGVGPLRLLAEDRQPAIRRGLKMSLGLEEALEVVSEAGAADGAFPLARALRPDVILLDIEMPGGIALTEALRAAAPHSAVVVLTLRDDAATWEQARAAGAMAFVAKHRTEGIFLASIRGVALANAKRRRRGRAPVSREEEHTDAMRDRRGA